MELVIAPIYRITTFTEKICQSAGSEFLALRMQKWQSAFCFLFPAGSLLGILFNPEDGGDMFLQKSADFL
jgi:hypothetical protein